MPNRSAVENILVPALAFIGALVLFGIFVGFRGVNPIDLYSLMFRGAFGSWFSWQNTLLRAAPLLLTALCTALPAQLGMVIIGGEGAFVIGGLAAAAAAMGVQMLSPLSVQLVMALAGIAAGGIWIAIVGVLRFYRGVNETIASLLMVYIGIAILNQMVEGPLKDPASLNKPSTPPIGDVNMIGNMPGTEIHWGLAVGIVACILSYILVYHTVFGFAARTVGGNLRTAKLVGLPIGRIVIGMSFLAGAAPGLAGMIEVGAVQGQANATLGAGYGFTGILVSFLSRHHPLAIIPVSILLGGIAASGGLLQRRLGLPDAATLVLEGIIFVCLLASEALYGRLSFPLLKRA
jgi:simple sugar transport system permease protein